MSGDALKGKIEFQFEYLAMLSAQSLNNVLMQVDLDKLAIALKDVYASKALANVLRVSLSPEAFEHLKQLLLNMGSFPVAEVRKQQWHIVAIVRNLAIQKKITVPECFYFPTDKDIALYNEFLQSGKPIKRSFKMEDIARLDDRSIQHLLFTVNEDDLVKSLVYASIKARRAVYRNMTREASNQLEKKILASHECTTQEIVTALKNVIRCADNLLSERVIHYNDEMIV